MTEKKIRFSKVKAGLAALALGALLVIPAGAQDDSTASVEVTGGSLNVSIEDANLGSVPFSMDDQTTSGSAAITVSDMRGLDGVWHVTLQSTDFDGDSGSIPASNLTYTGATNEVSGGGVEHASDENLGGEVTIAEGSDAHGDHSWDGGLSLNVPGETLAGTYSSTLTLTSVAGAPDPGN